METKELIGLGILQRRSHWAKLACASPAESVSGDVAGTDFTSLALSQNCAGTVPVTINYRFDLLGKRPVLQPFSDIHESGPPTQN